MATIEVNTWATLAAAIVSAADGDTIKLTANIDCNLEYSQGVAQINIATSGKDITISGKHAPTFEVNRYYSKTVVAEEETYTVLQAKPNDWDSNYQTYYYKENFATKDEFLPVEPARHKILNLQNAASNTYYIIYSDGLVTLEYIDWQNLLLSGAHFVKIVGSDTDAGVVAEHCRFTGTRSGEAYLFDVGHDKKIQLISCAFDMPWMGANAPYTAIDWTALAPKWDRTEEYTCSFTADYCNFKEHYTGWGICNQPTGGGGGVAMDGKPRQMYSCAPFAMNGCYISGDVTISCYASAGYFNIINPKSVASVNAQSAMNVFDCDISSVGSQYPTGSAIKLLSSTLFGIMTMRAKDVDGEAIETYSLLSNTYIDNTKAAPIYVTTKQFGNDKSLSEKGFDIILPNEVG